MFILMIAVFVLGYIAIALEHPIKIDKAATALITGALCWGIYAMALAGYLAGAGTYYLLNTSGIGFY